MEILLLLVAGTINIFCFFIGAKVGQTVAKGERIELPNINLIEAIQREENRREADDKQEKLAVIMRNIERYDGTSIGQEDV